MASQESLNANDLTTAGLESFGSRAADRKIHPLLKVAAGRRRNRRRKKSPDIITTGRKVSLTGHALAFHRHYSKLAVLYSARQAQPCIMKCLKKNKNKSNEKSSVCAWEGRGARYSGSCSITSAARAVEPWGHSIPSMVYLCIHITVEWEWSLSIDPF